MPGLGIRARTPTPTPTQPRPDPNPDAHPEQKRANKSRAGYGARAEPLLKSFQRGTGAAPLIPGELPGELPAELHDLGAQQITSFVNPASTSSGSSRSDGVAAGDGGEGLLASVSAAVSPSNEDVAAPPNAVSGWA